MNAVILAVIALSGWKGETVSFFRDVTNGTADARLVAPAFAALPEGWTAKAGVLRGVRYATEPYGEEYRVAADRVEWDGTTNLAAGASCRAVGSVTVPPGAKAGDYAFSFAGEKVTMHVADRVLPPPSEWKYHMDMWHNPFSIARLTGTKPWSDEHFEAMRPFMALTAAWGQKGIVVSISDYPWCHQCYDGYTTMIRHIKNPKTGKWTFDYAVFDKWVQFNFDTGNGKYISCYSLCPWGYAVYWEDPTGHPNRLEAKPGTKEFEEYWTPFLADFTRHLKEKGWLEKVQLCFDERGAEDVRKITAFLDRVAPWFCVHAATDGDPAKFDDLRTKAFTQALWEITPEFLRGCHARRARGERAGLTYVCCKPERPNNFFWSDPDDNFWIQVYPIAHGLAGSTRWTVDSWPRDPMNDATYYNWPSSDTYFIYPDASPSIRYLLILNGVQNGEKWRILYDEQKERRAELDALAERYDIRQALNKKDGDFADLIADTLKILNEEGDSNAAECRAETALELGVPADGQSDAVAPLHAAFARGVREVTFAKGAYRLDQTLRLPSGTKLVASADARFFAAPGFCADWVVCNADLENGDAGIVIDGGAWDGNYDERPGKSFDPDERHGGVFFHFRKVRGLTVRNLRAYDSVTYHFSLSRVTDFSFEKIRLGDRGTPFCQDGIHIGGGCARGRVDGVVAYTGGMGDDLIALNADDVYRYAWNRGQIDAPIRDITVENIVASNCYTVVRLLSVKSPIERVVFRNIVAGYRQHGINVDAARYCAHPLFTDETSPRGVGCLSDVLFENCELWCTGGNREVVTYETNGGNVRFKNFRYRRDLDRARSATRPIIRLRKMDDTVVTDGGTRQTVPCGGTWAPCRDALEDVRIDAARQ